MYLEHMIEAHMFVLHFYRLYTKKPSQFTISLFMYEKTFTYFISDTLKNRIQSKFYNSAQIHTHLKSCGLISTNGLLTIGV